MTERRLSILLALLIALIYLLFLTRAYFWDGVMFAMEIEDAYTHQQAVSTLLSANHLVYSLFGFLAYLGSKALQFPARAINVLQIWNAVVGALVAHRIWQWLRREKVNAYTAAGAVALVAFGATWWKFATDADAYIIALGLFLLAVLFAFDGNLVAAILCHTGAMLFHELSVFAYVPILLASGMLSLPPRERRRRMIIHVLVTGLLVGSAYLVAYRSGPQTQHPTLASWVTDYAPDTPVAPSLPEVIRATAGSYVKLFVGGKLSTIRQQFSPGMAIGLALCAASLVFMTLGLRGGRAEGEPIRNGRMRAVLWSWLLPLALFFLWFDPGNAGHKLFIWPPIVLLLATANWSQRHGRALLGLGLAIGAWNFGVYILPHASRQADPVVSFAERLDKEMPPKAAVYYSRFITDDWYLRYFAPGRRWQAIEDWKPKADGLPTCLETTALELKGHPPITAGQSVQSWELKTAQHRVRMTCWS